MGSEVATIEPTDIVESSFTKRQAEQLDKRIRTTVTTLQANWDKLNELVAQAKDGNLHIALGFNSWTAYLADAVHVQPTSIEERRELVALLAGEGMSNRAIGAVVGADDRTVRRDIDAVEAASGESVASAETEGLDGKSYKKKRSPKQAAESDEPEVIDAEVVEDEPELPLEGGTPPVPVPTQDLEEDFDDATTNLTSDVKLLQELLKHSEFDFSRADLKKRHLKALRAAFRDLEGVVQTLEA